MAQHRSSMCEPSLTSFFSSARMSSYFLPRTRFLKCSTRVEHFKNLVRGKKYDDILALEKKLVNEGSHMLDLCCAIVGEDEKDYITSILERIATRVPAPILVDSTEADVVEEALKRIPGKAIINSINLEDGEKRTSKVLPMAKRYGAGVIAL